MSELLTNTTWESGSSGWTLTNNSCEDAYGTTTAQYHDGTHAAFMYTDGGSPYIKQDVSVSAGDQATLSFWAKGSICRYAVYDVTHSTYIQSFTSLGTLSTWTQTTLTFTVPSGCTTVRVCLGVYGGGFGYFDDASLTTVALTPIVVYPDILHVTFVVNDVTLSGCDLIVVGDLATMPLVVNDDVVLSGCIPVPDTIHIQHYVHPATARPSSDLVVVVADSPARMHINVRQATARADVSVSAEVATMKFKVHSPTVWCDPPAPVIVHPAVVRR